MAQVSYLFRSCTQEGLKEVPLSLQNVDNVFISFELTCQRSYTYCRICAFWINGKHLYFFSVVAMESHPFSVGDTITMRLMKRAKVKWKLSVLQVYFKLISVILLDLVLGFQADNHHSDIGPDSCLTSKAQLLSTSLIK